MSVPITLADRRAASFFLVLGSALNYAGILMYNFSMGYLGHVPRTSTFVLWERSLLVAAVVLTVLGFVFLERVIAGAGGSVFATAGASLYAFGAVLVAAAETLSFSLGESRMYGPTVAYVILAFIAQACVGAGLLRSGVVAGWVGWLAITWNLGLLVVLSAVSAGNMYFPLQHHIVPLVMGISLLRKAPSA